MPPKRRQRLEERVLGNMFTASLDITWPTRPGILTPPRCLVREMPGAVAEKLRAAQRNRTRQSSERTTALSATAGLVTSHQLPARQGDAGQDLIGTNMHASGDTFVEPIAIVPRDADRQGVTSTVDS